IWSVYTMEYYSAIKKNEILLFAMLWMELEGIMLNEVSQSFPFQLGSTGVWQLMRGTWVAQVIKCPTLDLSSGFGLRAVDLGPVLGLDST
uniref:Uncharacterized protein n=1 Tax=Canis lupus familiaris TaxID=9615 RepID=A0A8I3RZ56_CANLF